MVPSSKVKGEAIVILGIGGACWDELLYLDRMPGWDENISVLQRDSGPGGMVASALVAASRLGLEVELAGIRGEDTAGESLVHALAGEGLGLSLFQKTREGATSSSVILVQKNTGSRSILNTRGVQTSPRLPHEQDLLQLARQADAIHLDGHFFRSLLELLPQLEDNAPLVTLDPSSLLLNLAERDRLIALCDYLIPSRSWAERYCGSRDMDSIFRALLPLPRQGVVVSCGSGGLYYATREDREPKHLPAFSIDPVDTTGAGDAFHGAFIASLVQKYPLEESLIRASAAAAINCLSRGAQRGLPGTEQLQKFLETNMA